MRRRDFLKSALAAAGTPVLRAAAPPERPNIVFFLVDDLGWMDLSCQGSRFYETPNIDRLAAEGMLFTDGYAACPVCSPTRASIMTGKYPARVGITEWIHSGGANQPENWKKPTKLLPAPYLDHLPLEEATLAEALREGGYATFFAGKWHLGEEGFWPQDQGFEINRGGCGLGHPPSFFSPYRIPQLDDGLDGEHLPGRLARETCAFIEARRDVPFLAFLSFYSVHTPLQARRDLIEKYEAKAAALPAVAEVWGMERDNKLRVAQNHPVYAGMVEAMDQAVGEALRKLDELNLREKTLVIFMSDNGGLSTAEGHPTSNLPLRAGKGWLYEGGIREPMIVRWPGVTKPGSRCSTPVTSADFYPTILEAGGLPARPRQHVDGMSLVPLLRGEPLRRGPIYWHYPHYSNQGGFPGGAVRDGRWKLIENFESGNFELYDLESDLSETRDLAAEQPEIVKDLVARLRRWQKETNAKFPSPRASTEP
jgi:arylsulfatase A-like enzyme